MIQIDLVLKSPTKADMLNQLKGLNKHLTHKGGFNLASHEHALVLFEMEGDSSTFALLKATSDLSIAVKAGTTNLVLSGAERAAVQAKMQWS